MSELSKEAFIEIVTEIVTGFEDPAFQRAFAQAKADSDVPAMMRLPTEIQNRAFAKHGLDAANGTVAFKAAGRQHASDPAVAELLMRMKAAL